MFRARLPSIFITSHKMPRLPRNLHLVVTWCSPDTQHDTSEALRPPCKMTIYDDGHVQSAAPATKTATHLAKTSQKSIAPATQNDFRHLTKHVTKRSYATLETSKSDSLCRAYYRHSHTTLTRTVADGCGRLGNVERTHPQPPRPPEWRNPCYAFGKKWWLKSQFSFDKYNIFCRSHPTTTSGARRLLGTETWCLPVRSLFHHGVNKGLQWFHYLISSEWFECVSPLKKGPAAGSVWDEQLVSTAGVPCVTCLFSIVTARFNIWFSLCFLFAIAWCSLKKIQKHYFHDETPH